LDDGHGNAVVTVGGTRTFTIDNFDYRQLKTVADGHDAIIFDPPASASASNIPTVSIGGAGDDTFVFQSGEGGQTISTFNPQQDTIEIDHSANIQSLQELTAATTPDAHDHAAIELGHGDNVAIPGVSATTLQQHVQSLAHLHA
jgi:hypothetical protein